jgi:hypothetical protein
MRRLHLDDLTGFLLPQDGWRHVKLPAIAPATLDIEIAWLKAHYWKEGTALEEEREPLPVLAALKQDMPPRPCAAPEGRSRQGWPGASFGERPGSTTVFLSP